MILELDDLLFGLSCEQTGPTRTFLSRLCEQCTGGSSLAEQMSGFTLYNILAGMITSDSLEVGEVDVRSASSKIYVYHLISVRSDVYSRVCSH